MTIVNELSGTISQVLNYFVIAEENGIKLDEIAIFSSKFDETLVRVIKRFNLPIRIFIITRKYHCEIK